MTVSLVLRSTAKQEVNLKCLNRGVQTMLGNSLFHADVLLLEQIAW